MIAGELHERGVDVEAAAAAGDLLMVDAEVTLATIMDGALPDTERPARRARTRRWR